MWQHNTIKLYHIDIVEAGAERKNNLFSFRSVQAFGTISPKCELERPCVPPRLQM